jgi:ribA/ribD-fused uncharacterized protein
MGGPGLIDGTVVDELDNFYIQNFIVDDVKFPSAEHYFQYKKCVDKEDFEKILNAKTGMESWVHGNNVKLRKDWETVKVEIMYEGNKAKFGQNQDLAKILTSTKGNVRFDSSTSFWNKWNGLIMERIRAELRFEDGTADETDKLTAEKLKKLMDDFKNSK